MSSLQTLPGSRIHCRETDEELVFSLPPRTVRGVIGAILIGGALLLCISFLGLLTYQVGWWGFVCPLPLAVFALLFLGMFFVMFVRAYLARTLVYIARERLVLKTIVLGRAAR